MIEYTCKHVCIKSHFRYDGVANVLVLRGPVTTIPSTAGATSSPKKYGQQQIKNITNLNHFEFLPTGITVRRHSNIGQGKFIKCNEVPLS
jgi:hypothetical protein